ncbi:hypothetical protein BLS_007954 [Venturia inaequalis]|uniref:Uncharacterized protein n=1 Tax=Venturia inaequalis TaxID=5025 RepID=A0A8H3V4P6_VENIN|nr:hypothetical protein BLS_007954 [Venturia inaequalis]
MAGYQSQRYQENSGTSYPDTGESLDLYGSSDEGTQPVQPFNVDLDPSLSGRPADSGARPYYGINYDDGIPQVSNDGPYQPNFRVDGCEQTYQDQTLYPQTQTPNHVSIDLLPPSLQAHPDPNTLSDSELFWVKYHHGANIGRDIFPRWQGLQTNDLPPRETIRLVPNEERNLPHLNGRLQILKNENGEQIRSELTDEHLYELPFLPRYIDMKTDATTKNIDNWIIMGADLRRDIIPRSINYNPYHSFDENGDEFFDWRATAAHLQRTYTNKHMKRAEQPHVMGGLLRKFRMDKGRFAEFLTPIAFDEQGNQRRMLLNMENLLFNTRWDIDLSRMVMKNPHSHQELPLFTPVDVRPQVRECLEKMLPNERVPTLHDLFNKYPHVVGYDEKNHPLLRRSEELDTQLRRKWEMEAARRGNRRPPVTVTKPNYAKGRKEITAKRKKMNTSMPEHDTLDADGEDEEEEQPPKRNKKTIKSSKPLPRRKISTITGGRMKHHPKLPRSPVPPHPSQYSVEQSSQQSTNSTYQETPVTATFHEASHTQMDLLLQPVGDSNLVPEELLYHPPIDCFDENGTFVQILISQYYAALTMENRQMYRNIRDTQGLDIAKQRLLETFGLQQTLVAPPMASEKGPGITPNQFASMTGRNDTGMMPPSQFDISTDFKQPHYPPLPNLPPDPPMPSFQDRQDYKPQPQGSVPDQAAQFYDPQLFGLDPNPASNQGQESLFTPYTGLQPLLSPWQTNANFAIDNLGAQNLDGVGLDPATDIESLNDDFVTGLEFTLDADQPASSEWGRFCDNEQALFLDDGMN